jgi:hypothetical protein
MEDFIRIEVLKKLPIGRLIEVGQVTMDGVVVDAIKWQYVHQYTMELNISWFDAHTGEYISEV